MTAAPDISGPAKDELIVPIAIAPAMPIVTAHCLKGLMLVLRGCRNGNALVERAVGAREAPIVTTTVLARDGSYDSAWRLNRD